MEQTHEALLVSGICPIGAVVFLALAIFPFQYGPLEATALAVGFVAFAIFETVLDDATFRLAARGASPERTPLDIAQRCKCRNRYP